MSSTTEDYIKHILTATQSSGKEIVSLGQLAELSGVTAGTVTTMMKKLAETGLVDYLPRRGVRLTSSGIERATRIVRRHRLIELFLVETLSLDWSDVHSEAEILEHAVSDRVLDRIDELLGFPTADPHGDPIPTSDGRVETTLSRALSDISDKGSYLVSRVGNDTPTFLAYLKRAELMPGQTFQFKSRDKDASTVCVNAGGHDLTMSLLVAGRIFVNPSRPVGGLSSA